MGSTELAFVSAVEQAHALRQRWDRLAGSRVVVCLDEALFPCAQAAAMFPADVTVVGRSDLGLSAKAVFAEALALATDFYGEREQSWPARVDGWLLESYKRWMIYAVHSIRVIEAALNQFRPQQVWIPDHASFPLTVSPDTDPKNPLFFDLLAPVCEHFGVRPNVGRGRERNLARKLFPLKYVAGEWTTRIKKKRLRTAPLQPRPVIMGNLDNDFHRQFDLRNLGSAAGLMFAWVRGDEALIPVEKLLERFGTPSSTKFAWLYDGAEDFSQIAAASGVKVRALAGLRYFLQSVGYQRRQRARFDELKNKYELPWADLLSEEKLPAIHSECRVAAAFYCVFEYERARSMLQHSRPDLLVTSADHWPYLPHLGAASDLGIQTLSTEAGLSFLQDNFAQKTADIVCLFGKSEVTRLTASRADAKIIFGGDALAQNGRVSTRHAERPARRVLFVMSGRIFGWWFGSLIFDYAAYTRAFSEFARLLGEQKDRVEIVIKSHPVSDLHDLYDQVVAEHDDIFVEHRREPMSDAEIADFDAAVIFSAASALIGEIIRVRLPLVYFTGALTDFGKEYFKYEGLEVAGDVAETVATLRRLLATGNDEARDAALRRQERFLGDYVDPPQRSFAAVLEEVLGRPSGAEIPNSKFQIPES